MSASLDIRGLAVAAFHAHADSDGHEWKELVFGAWVLIDQFDADGRRYLIAERRRCGSMVTASEWFMLQARARGEALKVIASDVGLSQAAVSRSLRRAMRKLGLRTRGDLARLLGPALESATRSPASADKQ